MANWRDICDPFPAKTACKILRNEVGTTETGECLAERTPWRSSQSCVTGISSLLDIPTDSCLISSAHLATLVRPQKSLVGKALSATRGLAPGVVRHSPEKAILFGETVSWWTFELSDIFYFFCSGEGKGESEAPAGGGDFYWKSHGWGRVGERPGGGGLDIFFRGRNSHEGFVEKKTIRTRETRAW